MDLLSRTCWHRLDLKRLVFFTIAMDGQGVCVALFAIVVMLKISDNAINFFFCEQWDNPEIDTISSFRRQKNCHSLCVMGNRSKSPQSVRSPELHTGPDVRFFLTTNRSWRNQKNGPRHVTKFCCFDWLQLLCACVLFCPFVALSFLCSLQFILRTIKKKRKKKDMNQPPAPASESIPCLPIASMTTQRSFAPRDSIKSLDFHAHTIIPK